MLQLRDPSGERNHKRKKGKEHKDKSVPPRMRIWYKEQVWDKITPGLQNWKIPEKSPGLTFCTVKLYEMLLILLFREKSKYVNEKEEL